MNKVTVSFMLGLAIGLLIAPLVLASEVDRNKTEQEWCFRQQFDSNEDFDAFRDTNPGDEFSNVFIKMNGKKLQVYTRCVDSPIPHRYSPYN